jgi:hypothetical protein
MALVSGLVLPVYFKKKMGITWGESVAHVWRPAFVGGLPAVVLMGVWKLVAPPDSWLGLCAVVMAAAIVTGVCAWFLSLGQVERRRLLAALGRAQVAPGAEGFGGMSDEGA